MNKKFKSYYYLILMIGMFFIIEGFCKFTLYKFDVLAIIITFTVASLSETLISEYSKDTTFSLSGPITFFAIIKFPLLLVYFIVLTYVCFSKMYSTFIKKEYKKIFDNKLIFNFFQFIILTRISYYLIEKINFLNSGEVFLGILLVASVHMILNIIFVGTVVSLYNSENGFKVYKIRELFSYWFYFVMISEFIYFSYESYGNFGLIFFIFFILPIQNTLLSYSKKEDVNKLLITDSLTGAYNRYYLENCVKDYTDSQKGFIIAFFDFDNFKKINDDYGHLAGDFVLKKAVNEIKNEISKKDKLFRYGGDEFCILLDFTDENRKRVFNIKEKLNSGSCQFEENEISYSYSTGFYEYDGQGTITFNDIMKILDVNMYGDKVVRKSKKNNDYANS